MKRILIPILVLVMSSCTNITYTYFQVFKTEPVNRENMVYTDNGIDYMDVNCVVSYSFWGENGYSGLSIYNTTDKVIYVNLAKSTFTVNGHAYDYRLEEPILIKHVNGAYSYSELPSVRTDICLPPHSYRVIKSKPIWETILLDTELERYPSDSASLSFTRSNTPILFTTRLVYNFGEGSADRLIDNEFYVTSITNYAKPTIIHYEERQSKPHVNLTNETPKRYSTNYPYTIYDEKYAIDTQDCFYLLYKISTDAVLYHNPYYNLVYNEHYQGYVRIY